MSNILSDIVNAIGDGANWLSDKVGIGDNFGFGLSANPFNTHGNIFGPFSPGGIYHIASGAADDIGIDVDIPGEEYVDAYTGLSNAEIEAQNLELAKDEFQWNQDVQRETWTREDTAYQRMVSDLREAGLSPALALGSKGSPTGGVVPTTQRRAGQTNYAGMGNLVSLVLSAMTAKANISKTMAEKRYIDQQKERTGVDTAIAARELHYMRKYGLTNNSSPVAKILRDVQSMFGEGFGRSEAQGKFGPIGPNNPDDMQIQRNFKFPWEK